MKNQSVTDRLSECVKSLEVLKENLRKEIDITILSDSVISPPRIVHESQSKENKGLHNNLLSISAIAGAGGLVSLFYGLVSDKIGFSIGGGIASLTGLAMAMPSLLHSQSNAENETSSERVDFQSIKSKVFRIVTKMVAEITNQWNSVVEDNHSKMNKVILDSSMQESEKSKLLAAISKEVPYSLSTTDFLTGLSKMTSQENLSGIKSLITDYQNEMKSKLESAYSEQMEVYSDFSSLL